MITSDQIESWIDEIEQRPDSAAEIIRAITARLAELDSWNEELLADNIALRSGERAEAYEKRIASLEYQLEMLKRQVGGSALTAVPAAEGANLLLFNLRGQMLRQNFTLDGLKSGSELARFNDDPAKEPVPPGLLVISPHEELLIAFDSGRTVTVAAAKIPLSKGELDWRKAYRVDPRPGEELSAVLPIARMSLHEACVQVSRRGCVKLMLKASFESFVARNAIGAGVKRKPDRTAALVFCARDGRLALASREGYLLSMSTAQLPFAPDEILQLSASDHIVAAFNPGSKSSILALTNNGKAIHREASWLEPAVSYKSRGQAVFSPARREAGVRVIGAAAVDENDWGMALCSDGALMAYSIADLLANGSVDEASQAAGLVSFAAFSPQG